MFDIWSYELTAVSNTINYTYWLNTSQHNVFYHDVMGKLRYLYFSQVYMYTKGS